MARTETLPLAFDTLRIRGKSAVTVVKLMMACNDLTVTNQALADWKQEERRGRASRQAGACRYFVRAQIGHLNESLKIIEEIKCDPGLLTLLNQCDSRTNASFQELQQYLKGGVKYDSFQQLVRRIRDNLAFHYDETGKLIQRAVADRADRSQATSITRGSTAHLWYFKVADDVVDSIVVREILKIPRDADLRSQTDRKFDEVHHIFLLFMDFAGEFIWNYCKP